MKKQFTFLVVFGLFSLLAVSQTGQVSFNNIKSIADKTAKSLWVNISEGDAFPLYSKDDNIVAYRFNFAINKPFPAKDALFQTCKNNYENGDKNAQWGVGEYGHIVVAARKDMDVIQSYSDVLSPEHSEGFRMRELAKEKIGGKVSLTKVYYINFENQWFCFTNGTDDIYVKVFPKPEAVNAGEFHKIVDNMKFFCETGDFSNVWNQYLSGNILAGKSQVWIPNHDGYCKYYDWSYGCSPTAAAMLVSWWDYNSINTSYNYSKLVDYHYKRYDNIEGEWDYQVPNAQKQLAIAMNTDTVSSGSTSRSNIVPGYQSFLNSTNGYNFTCTDFGNHSASWNFSKIQSEIGSYQRPLHISIPGHSECCVGYDVAANQIGVHNTWWGSVQWATNSNVERVYTFAQGGSNGYAVNLTSPLGDVGYNHNGSGETYYAGDVMEISWNSDYSYNSYVHLMYSTNGGYNWSYITSNTPNDGIYDWVIPSGINSSQCRVYVSFYTSGGTYSGSDGSFGNLKIYSGGSLYNLGSDSKINTTTDPDYYQFINSYTTWCAIGVRNNTSGDDWDIKMYDNNSFSNVVASSTYGGSTVDFVVMDGHHSPSQYRGIKAERYSGTGMASIEYEDYNETLSIGNNSDSWPAGDVVEMYDIYLAPGIYGFTLDVTSGSANLDFALFGSSGSAYYAPRSANLASSYSGGSGGDEYFTYTITTADYYGVCVWANDANTASYNLKVEQAGTWTGAVNNQWHNPGNWSGGIIPDATIDVTIPNVTNKCWIADSDAECHNLTLESGAGNYLRIYDETLHVYGDLTINAELKMDNASGVLDVDGNVVWNSGSTANFSANSVFWVSGNWNFESGANVQLANGIVDFTGTGTSWIRSYDSNCSFNHIGMYKSGSDWTRISDLSTEDLTINGTIYMQPAANFGISSSNNVILKGNLSNWGTFDFTGAGNTGTFVFDGTTQSIDMHTPTGTFNNVKFSSTGITSTTGDITVMGDLTIESGSFSPNSHKVYVGGNWNNTIGTAGFIETGSRVVFNGPVSGHQYCTSEHFDTLEVAKVAGGALRPFGGSAYNIVCEHYDWTAGAVDIIPGGSTFTANDLLDNGIAGAFYLNPGGTINLTNSGSNEWVDLNGELHIFGGTMNVTGSVSDWPYSHNATIEMSGGVLDFTSCGISITNNSYTLTSNITGGIIRTSKGFSGNRADFTPTAGTFEFYGATDYYFNQSNGCTLYDVNIDKSAKSGSSSSGAGKPEIDERSGMVMGPGSKLNTIGLLSDFVITNNLTVTSGELNLNGYELTVGHDCDVYGTLTMDNAADVLTFGQNYYDQLNFWSGSVANLSNGTANIYGWIVPRPACSFTASTSNTIVFKGVTGGGLSNFEPTAIYGNIIVDKNANEIAFIDNSATQPIVVNGSFTINPDNIFEMQDNTMIIHGTFTDNSSSEIYVYNAKKSNGPESGTKEGAGQGNPKSKGGYLELDNDFTLNGLLDVGDGDVLAHGNFGTASTASIIISGGTIIGDAPDYDKGWEYLNGNLTMSSGLFEFTYNSFNFGTTATTNVSGGTLRTGGAFKADKAGTFQPTGGTVEVIGNIDDNAIYCSNGNFFFDLLINRDPGVYAYFATEVFINNNLTINGGVLNSYYDYNINIGANWINNAGSSGFDEGNGTVIFFGSGDVTITPGETFYNLTLDKPSGGDWLTLTDDVTVLGDLIVNGGALHTAANTLDVQGNVDINSTAVLFVQAGGTLKIGDNKDLTANTGAHFYIEGSSSSQATLTHSGSGRYNCDIYGEIAANYATFEYMGQNGVVIYPGATINSVYTFNHCIFLNGAPAKGSAYLVLNSDNVFTSTDTYFENTSGNVGNNVWKGYDTGSATFQDYSGDFAGLEFEHDPYDRIHWGAVDVEMSLKVMLEGAYNGTDMNTDLKDLGLIPLNQPFNTNTAADWYYTGGESVGSIPANVVDWVLVQIRDASDAGSADAGTVVVEQAAFLLNDGSIVDLDGSSNLYFPGITYTSGLYPVVWHRNHLGIVSSGRMLKSGGVYIYDFTQAGSAYSNTNAGEKDLGGGVYGLFGGDGNGSGWTTYNGEDLNWWKIQAGKSNDYFETDYNLDGDVDNKDKNDVLNYNQDFYSQIPGSKSSGKTIDE